MSLKGLRRRPPPSSLIMTHRKAFKHRPLNWQDTGRPRRFLVTSTRGSAEYTGFIVLSSSSGFSSSSGHQVKFIYLIIEAKQSNASSE